LAPKTDKLRESSKAVKPRGIDSIDDRQPITSDRGLTRLGLNQVIQSKDLTPMLLCPFGYFHAFFIFEFPKYDDEEINEAPDPETSYGDKLYDTRDDFAYIKTVGPEHTKEKRQNRC
jgi:hypothetical protein